MKVLFVASANHPNGITPNITSQADVLSDKGISVDYFGIKGRFLQGYPAAIPELTKYIRQTRPDIVHAHFSNSGYISAMAGAKPLVLTLMGSDIMKYPIEKYVIRFLKGIKKSLRIIVQSEPMKRQLGIDNVAVIPNGIDIDRFKPLDKRMSQSKLNWTTNKTHILFASDPSRAEKNFSLAERALEILDNPSIDLHLLKNVKHSTVPEMINASDIVLLTSLREGSPIVIKEAMLCNCPAVATDVGDIKWLFGKEPGYFISGFSPENMAENIRLGLTFAKETGKTNGRNRLIELGLDSESFAKNLINLYNQMI
jgi:teichuronic acid biosynthesis glycosyltransferase TuaC